MQDLVPATPSAVDLLVRLGIALHRCGTPAHRVEAALTSLSSRLALEAQFFSTPTSMFFAFGPPGHQTVSMVRVEPSGTDLARLALVDATINEVVQGKLSLADGVARLDDVLSRPPPYSAAVTTLFFTLSSAVAAVFLGGRQVDVSAAAGVGLVVGVLSNLLGGVPRLAQVMEPVVALVAAAMATALARDTGLISAPVVTLSAIVAFLPGMTLTVAMTEIATRNLASGSARLAGVLVGLLGLGFGAAMGDQLGLLVPAVRAAKTGALPPEATWVALCIAPIALNVLLRGRIRDLPWVLPTSMLAYQGAVLGRAWFGAELGPAVGTLVLGTLSNLIANWRNQPAMITIVPGLLLLVPGSLGFRSVALFLDREVLVGIETAFSMIVVAAALASGLLLSNVLAPPRKAF